MKDDKKSEQYRNEGNEEFKRGKFYEALIAYNKSLCFAEPQKSKNLALAYANRSAVYLEINQPDKCMENIKLARAAGYPDKERLNEREDRCLKLKEAIDREAQVQDPDEDPMNFFKLSYPANEKIPSVVDCLEIRENEKFGRHIVTTRDLNPGDVIAIEEPIFKRISGCYARCTNCMKSNIVNLIPCEGNCSYAMFCDQKCSEEAQRRFPDLMPEAARNNQTLDEKHIKWVTTLRIVYESLVATGSVERLRALMKNKSGTKIQDFDFRKVYSTNQSITVKQLEFLNKLKVTDDDRAFKNPNYIAAMKTVAVHPMISKFINSQKDQSFIVDFALRVTLTLANNFATYCLIENLHGFGLWPFSIFFNHSCDPNVASLENETKFVFVVLKPIKKDEQLSIAYAPIFTVYFIRDRTTRQQKILEKFNFICDCDVCTSELDPSQLPYLDNDKYFEMFYLPTLQKKKDARAFIEEFKKNCEYLKPNEFLKIRALQPKEIFTVQFRNSFLLHVLEEFLIFPVYLVKPGVVLFIRGN